MSAPTVRISSELTSDAVGETCTLYVHVETRSERLMRLSNALADRFIGVAAETGREIASLAEAADALAEASYFVEGVARLYLSEGSWP